MKKMGKKIKINTTPSAYVGEKVTWLLQVKGETDTYVTIEKKQSYDELTIKDFGVNPATAVLDYRVVPMFH